MKLHRYEGNTKQQVNNIQLMLGLVVAKLFTVTNLFTVADLAPPPPRYSPKFSQFHVVFRKIWQNHMLAPPPTGNPGSAPDSGEMKHEPCHTEGSQSGAQFHFAV